MEVGIFNCFLPRKVNGLSDRANIRIKRFLWFLSVFSPRQIFSMMNTKWGPWVDVLRAKPTMFGQGDFPWFFRFFCHWKYILGSFEFQKPSLMDPSFSNTVKTAPMNNRILPPHFCYLYMVKMSKNFVKSHPQDVFN